MRPADNIEKLVKKLRYQSSGESRKRIFDNVATVLESKQKRPAPAGQNIWRIIMKNRITKLTAAAVVIIAILLGLNFFDNTHSTAFAQALDQIVKAKTITWSTTFYSRVTSKDGERSWIKTETRQLAYKSPGLYREERLDENMQIKSVKITDAVNLKKISLNPAKKEATVRELAVTTFDSEGPFAWVRKKIKEANLELAGNRDVEGVQVNIFRTAFRDVANNEDWSYDFWIDDKTKNIVAVQVPGADIYDPENDPAFGNPPEEAWSTNTPMTFINHDISFDMELDDSLFELQAPEGYTVTNIARQQVTEKEMVDYLGILADYYDRTFPERLFPAVTSDKLNAIEDKPKNNRTAAEQKLLETNNYYKMANLNMGPIGHFIEDHTVKNSFRYMGKGVNLGDQNRIVCWYKLKDSNTYRAVYGDLSVKDIGANELPLKVEP